MHSPVGCLPSLLSTRSPAFSPSAPRCSAELREQGYTPAVQYITQYEFVGRAAAKAGQLAQAVLPLELRTDPHAYLRKLNHVSALNQPASLPAPTVPSRLPAPVWHNLIKAGLGWF